jgi:hypothetical protein
VSPGYGLIMVRPAAEVPHPHDDTPREDHFVHLSGLEWADYERLLAARGEHSGPRLCFDDGQLWTSGAFHKVALYGALGVPEVWEWRQGALRVYVRGADGAMVEARESVVLRGLDLQQLLEFVDRPTLTAAQREYRRALRA